MTGNKIPEYENPQPLERSLIPDPVFDDNPSLVDFYWLAWELAWDHVVTNPDAPRSPYMDEGFSPEKIWIWDTCLMALFARYAPEVFPAAESLDNFYIPLHEQKPSPLVIHHPDNPPLFAWAEHAAVLLSGNMTRINYILKKKGYLQKHFAFFDSLKAGDNVPSGACPPALQKTEKGYLWSGNPSGMDNTPRGRDDYASILWIDALAQQALSALMIARLSRMTGEGRLHSEYLEKHASLCRLINEHYWDDECGFYFDIKAEPPHKHVKVMTPASYWCLMAEAAGEDQAARMCKHATDPEVFGGTIPWPTVARSDPDFIDDGRYWRGGVWLPTGYMGIKSLENYSFYQQADALATNLIKHMHRTWQEYKPHTIWETYHPEMPMPAAAKSEGSTVRPDFCGWSALGPIALFIENMLGFRSVNAPDREIIWDITRNTRHGLKNLKMGDIRTDLTYENGKITADSNKTYTLIANGKKYRISQGCETFPLIS